MTSFLGTHVPYATSFDLFFPLFASSTPAKVSCSFATEIFCAIAFVVLFIREFVPADDLNNDPPFFLKLGFDVFIICVVVPSSD